ncbi:hypothetical protein [Thermofilum pendens]|uniref:Uncharacterized protein n=1 Tax=Thermofilum pendens (strain DSM 2475 / Hrk 5) TaxID=368408 RepID=A1S022_THEPD|nr:hypothetical protein [Thermofilum pendens]ABL78802.1 hypothetical protein Tpen_1405 [Thermofilum pendens Hrk 5]
MSASLSEPPEPLEIKEKIRALRSALGAGLEADRLAVWTGNMLARYLWGAWGAELKRAGFTWQSFMSLLKLHTDDVVAWALRDNLSWGELVRRVISSVEGRRRSDLSRFLG